MVNKYLPLYTWTCRCGSVSATIPIAKSLHVGCYCTFCRHFLTDMGAADALDAAGGVDYLHTTPDNITFTRGQDRLGVVRYSSRGAYRWYTTCCNTPFANALPNPKIPYASVTAHWVAPQEALGPHGMVAFTKSSTAAPVMHSHARTATLIKFATRTLNTILSGKRKQTPFFDDQGQPAVAPERRPGPPR